MTRGKLLEEPYREEKARSTCDLGRKINTWRMRKAQEFLGLEEIIQEDKSVNAKAHGQKRSGKAQL